MPALTDARVDAYIAKSAAFAQPLLAHWRSTVHQACPGCSETIKWGMPFFMHDGRILAQMAAFKAHCAFGVGHGTQVVNLGLAQAAMGQFGRVNSLAELPPKRALLALLKKQQALLDAGVARPRAPKTGLPSGAPKPPPVVPEELAAALKANAAARKTFAAFSPSHQREYIEWIVSAKRAETRARRLAQTLAQLEEGKTQNWKYERRAP